MFWVRGRWTTRVNTLMDLLHRALPDTMGGNPDLFQPEGGWDAWEEDVKVVLAAADREEPGEVARTDGSRRKHEVMAELGELAGAQVKQCGLLEQHELARAHGVVLHLVDGRTVTFRVADNVLRVALEPPR